MQHVPGWRRHGTRTQTEWPHAQSKWNTWSMSTCAASSLRADTRLCSTAPCKRRSDGWQRRHTACTPCVVYVKKLLRKKTICVKKLLCTSAHTMAAPPTVLSFSPRPARPRHLPRRRLRVRARSVPPPKRRHDSEHHTRRRHSAY